MGKVEPPPRLSWTQRICYGVGHSLNDLCASMWFSYLIVYLQLVLGFDSNYAGFVLLVGQMADAIATPLLGYESCNDRETALCKKYGKRKSLHLIGTICVVLSFPFIFAGCPGCEKASEFALTLMLVPLVIIFQIGWAAVQVSHLSLIPAITPHETERDFLNILRYAVNIMSDIGTYVVVWCVFDLTRKPFGNHHTITGDYANKFLMISLIIVGIGSVFSIIFHLGVKEVVSTPLSSSENSQEKDNSGLSNPTFPLFPNNLSWRGWMRESHFYQVGLLYMLTRMYQNMSLVFMPLYIQESLRADNDFIAKIPLVMNVSSFFISCCLPKFFKIFSKKVTFLGGASMGIGACVWIIVGSGPTYVNQGVYGVGVLIGAASSSMVICALSFIHDLIGTSVETAPFVYGFMSFWDKIANGIVGMIVQHLHAVSCKDCDWFYQHVMSYGVGAVGILASIVITTLLPSNLGERQSVHNDDFYLDRKPRKPRFCELAYLFTAWYFWISLLCVCFMLMTLLMVCVLCCCRNRKNDTSTVLGRILLSLPPTLFTTRDPDGIIQPNVMFYSRPPTRDQASTAIVARALPPMTAKDRLTTPIMPLNPAYQPSQPVTVTSSTSTTVINSNELTLPPGYVVNRDVKYC